MGWLSLKDLGRMGGYEVCNAVVVIVDILGEVGCVLRTIVDVMGLRLKPVKLSSKAAFSSEEVKSKQYYVKFWAYHYSNV